MKPIYIYINLSYPIFILNENKHLKHFQSMKMSMKIANESNNI